MLEAILEGKISRDFEGLEDVLTSNVFGLLKYLPPEVGLIPFLRLAKTKKKKGLELDSFSVGTTAKYCFWPPYKEEGCMPCEPDVVIELESPNQDRMLVLIEAKYLSGISSEADDTRTLATHQLAKEYCNLAKIAQDSRIEEFLVVFLTSDTSHHWGDIEDALMECKSKGIEAEFYWLTWRELPSLFRGRDDPILADIVSLCERLGLTFFEGLTFPKSIRPLWNFETSANKFCWKKPPDINNPFKWEAK